MPLILERTTTEQRRLALAQADAQLRIEGLVSSQIAAPLFEKYATTALTAAEVRQALLKHYQQA